MRALFGALGRVQDRHNQRLAALMAAIYNAPLVLRKPDDALWLPADFSGEAKLYEPQSAEEIGRRFAEIAAICKSLKKVKGRN